MSEALTTSSPQKIMETLGCAARKAAENLTQSPEDQINAALTTLAQKLRENHSAILDANAKDLENARQKGQGDALIDRLRLTPARIEAMASGVETVRDLPTPVGHILWETTRPNGLRIQRISVPIGVLGMIYESRPNVTIDASALCLKSGNAVILRGGSESLHSSLALHKLIQSALESNGIPGAAVSMVPTADRALVGAMLAANEFIDVLIPRGGHSLIERVMNEARMPVFGHLEGICHVYIHPSAKPEIAKDVTLNAKMRRTGICGAMETLLIDQSTDKTLVHDILTRLLDSGCALVGDEKIQAFDARIQPATAEDWRTEYLDSKLSCAFVDGVKEAVHHINHYGSHHTDSILAESPEAVEYFLKNVDSGIVMNNTSTQFADGGEFGMGAEIGIATGKMHARGPVGLEQLCTYKYIVRGTGQTRP